MRPKRWLGVAVAVAAVVTVPSPIAEAADVGPTVPEDVRAAVADEKSGVYIVVMRDEPVVAYDGAIAGLAPTQPTTAKLDRATPAVRRYVGYLRSRQDQALRSAGVPASAKLATYTYAANGFAARLTASQKARLERQPYVSLVVEDVVHRLDRVRPTARGSGSLPELDPLGLTDNKGPFSNGFTGEGVVVGVIDSGVWPEHPSLSPAGYGPYTGAFTGTGCDFGDTGVNPADAAFACNNKLLAAKAYSAVLSAGTGPGFAPGEFGSARDADGHGTHTATTAVGNRNVLAAVFGNDLARISGVAPRARLSVYKACWITLDGEVCAGGDLAAAIDDAVADGVDVINYSIGSDAPGFAIDALSFLFAYAAGVHVAVSAGNAGPGEGTIGSPAGSSWVTTVGATTPDYTFEAEVRLGNGRRIGAGSVTGGLTSRPLVDAAGLGNEYCDPAVAFTGPVAGRIVICKRGLLPRVDKSRAVALAGGSGMVLYNADPTQDLGADMHWVPTAHVSYSDGIRMKSYVAATGSSASASFTASDVAKATPKVVAPFSSRGENRFAPDVLKPDLVAPGQDILAGASPASITGPPGQWFQTASGTSMSSPQVAGLLALLTQAHPDWTPAAARSALMTTADTGVDDPAGGAADPFAMGAGLVSLGGDVRKKGSLFEPGLVYDSGVVEHVAAACDYFAALAEALLAPCPDLQLGGLPTEAEDLNLASITIGEVLGSDTVTRRVTNVSDRRIKVKAKVKAPPGFSVSVSPKQLTVDAGATAEFTVTVARTNAVFETWRFGSITWEGDGYEVRSPLSVRALALAVDAEVTGSGSTGSAGLGVRFGYTGPYSVAATDLVAGESVAGYVGTGGSEVFGPLTVAPGTALARFAISGAEPGADLDLYVFDDSFALVAFDADADADERVDLFQPAPGAYYVLVDGYSTDSDGTPYTFETYRVPGGVGSLAVTAPSSAVTGAAGVVNLGWSGLGAGKYLALVTHTGPGGVRATSTLAVEVAPA